MKKVFFSLFVAASLMAGATFADAASNKDEFKVRFRENTLVVTSTGMSEARLYNMNGKLIEKQFGPLVEFELSKGSYRLYAKVDGQMVARRIELR